MTAPTDDGDNKWWRLQTVVTYDGDSRGRQRMTVTSDDDAENDDGSEDAAIAAAFTSPSISFFSAVLL